MTDEKTTSSKDHPQCSVCYEDYDSTVRVPKVYPCGHTFCESCIIKLPEEMVHGVSSKRCPKCRYVFASRSSYTGRPLVIPTNFDLLGLAQPNENEEPLAEIVQTHEEASKAHVVHRYSSGSKAKQRAV